MHLPPLLRNRDPFLLLVVRLLVVRLLVVLLPLVVVLLLVVCFSTFFVGTLLMEVRLGYRMC